MTEEQEGFSGCECDCTHIGILLVHGVGFQQRGETLLEWSRALIDALAGWRRTRPFPANPVVHSLLDREPGGGSLIVELDVPGETRDQPHQHWLVTEAFWAGSVSAPKVSQVTTWLSTEGGVGRIVADALRLPAWLDWLAATLTALLLLMYAGARLVVGLVPISALREAIAVRMAAYISGWLGDMQVLLADRAQSSHLQARLADSAAKLTAAGCTRFVLIAHSGGAVLSLMAMPALAERGVLIDRYVTLGQGLRIAWELTGIARSNERCEADAASGEPLAQHPTSSHPAVMWRDYFADADPVPNGPLVVPPCFSDQPQSCEIWNTRSQREDHDGYWANTEEFLLPVLALVDTVGRPGATSRFERPDLSLLQRRRRTRVQLLAAYRTICTVLPLIAIAGSLSVQTFGPLQQLGNWLGEVGQRLPLSQLISSPVAWLRDSASFSQFTSQVTTLGEAALTTGLALALLLSARVTLDDADGRRDRVMQSLNYVLTATAIVSAAFLLVSQDWYLGTIRGVQEVHLLSRLGVEDQALNNLALLTSALLVVGACVGILLLLRWKAAAVFRGAALLGQALALAVLVAVPFAGVIAIAVVPQFGLAALSGAVLFFAFALLKAVGKWRWDRWERSVRKSILDQSTQVTSDAVPISALASLTIAAVALAAATFAGPSMSTAAAMLLFSAAVLLATIFLSLAWDAYSSASRSSQGYAGSNLIPD